ncbi:Uncharacterized protein dnm_023800 [Desulfonema magnum]|uniref:Uncharacterized protein n=1 Tax=Desulfonema magnum TaxID=45655 RepID=A0A975BJ93_9BACT|nr:Uncharacterized protein dnm_023800 [Desulfonema magnum]
MQIELIKHKIRKIVRQLSPENQFFSVLILKYITERFFLHILI